ncbi:hypothetical protein NJ76_20625 [Rhodococcus sp. IITR03]|nr:hypothetical protein NJ76_20625 [Rhodococcus sp. IITR03]
MDVRLRLGPAVVSLERRSTNLDSRRNGRPRRGHLLGVGVRPAIGQPKGSKTSSTTESTVTAVFPLIAGPVFDGDAAHRANPHHDRSTDHLIGGVPDCGVLGRDRTWGRRYGARRAVDACRRSSSYRRVNIVLEFSHVA